MRGYHRQQIPTVIWKQDLAFSILDTIAYRIILNFIRQTDKS